MPTTKARGAVAMESASRPFSRQSQIRDYESWYSGPGRRAARLEKRLLGNLAGRFNGSQTLLEIGCGTGHFSRWFAETGFEVTGLDISPAMLREARARGGPTYIKGDALDLPLPSMAVDLAAMITSLEFVSDASAALAEATRVARHGLIIGVINRTSHVGWRRRQAGGPIWSAARFFSPTELVRLVRAAGDARIQSIKWRTTLWPLPAIGSLPLPWGGFVGLAAGLHPGNRGTGQ